jgi:hypothetical protein
MPSKRTFVRHLSLLRHLGIAHHAEQDVLPLLPCPADPGGIDGDTLKGKAEVDFGGETRMLAFEVKREKK